MFEAAFRQALSKLRKAQTLGLIDRFAVIGGFAVARWGYARATADIDLVIVVHPDKRKALAEKLGGRLSLGDIRDPLLATISFEELTDGPAVPVQLIELPKSWQDAAFVDVQEEQFENFKIPVVNWPALVLLKLYAGGALDLEDALQVIKTVAPKEPALAELRKKATALRVNRKLEQILKKASLQAQRP